MRRDIEESLNAGSKAALVSFEGHTLRVLGKELEQEKDLLIIDATLSKGVIPLLMLAQVVGKYEGFIDEVYGPYAVSMSLSDELGNVKRKFLVTMNLLRFLERQTLSRIRAYTSYTQLDDQFLGVFDEVTFVR